MKATWVKVHNFQNPELLTIKSYNLQGAYIKIATISSLNGQLSLQCSYNENKSKKPLESAEFRILRLTFYKFRILR